ncbi:MAG: ABC transporter permease [Actinomycetota bacterium]|nr:ABC transporter permease [Actinomycetota bacterium]
MTDISVAPPKVRRQRRRLGVFMKRKVAVAGGLGIVLIFLLAIFAPVLTQYSPTATDFSHLLAPPFSSGHLFGTDQLGRDTFARLIYGTQSTLEVGVVATLFGTAVAVPIGIISGYYRGWVDSVIMRITDVILAFPFLVIAVGLAAILGPSLRNAILALGIAQIPGVIRIARAEALGLREQEFVQAAVASGASDPTILVKYLFPNMLSPLVVQASVAIPGAILGSALLSFLGVGVQPPTPAWGSMLATAQTYLYQDYWLAVLPGLAILLTTLCFNFFGDGLRDALDPSIG